ncbi:hypothetical protein KFZ56_08655 [Virgibacillus sp. NKC19-3]|uniref:hypothetical protein n=1 Tax=Virgibacillus saliphilus TaxID=2831674 RepID=UPI001C9ADBE2|nr:hypothetical protein [Virgibacillus sp. NKC19-3]MBY7143126.1 hypothetical protein [Virgibacillus sp. NKC19-3]
MSDKKQVIHVKDLVIKADNVHIERPRHDPFFGPLRGERNVDVKSSDRKNDDKEENSENKPDRRSFWF